MGDTYAYTPDIWLPLAGSIFLAVLGLYSWQRRSVPAALPLFASLLFGLLWILGIILGTAAIIPAARIAWHKFQAVWQLPVATAMVCFALEYIYPGRWLTRRNLTLLALPCLLTLLLIVSNDGRLMWRQLEIAPDGSVLREFTTPGAILVGSGLSLVLINIAAFIWLFIRSPQHRWPVALMLAGDVAARSLYALSQWDADLTLSMHVHDAFVVALLLGWAMYAIALFGFRIFDPLPAARTAVFSQMPEGLVVFDAHWRVASLNPKAEKILSIRAGRARGRLLAEVLPEYCDEVARCRLEDTTRAEISLGTGTGLRQYDLNFTTLKDFRALTIGHLLMLRDVTERRHAQALLLEHQRTLAILQERERLARELHDNLGQVLAFVTTQGQAIHRLLARGEIAEADDHVGRLVEVASEANTDVRESILGLRIAFDAQGLLPTLATYLGQYEKRYGIHTVLSAPQSLGSSAFEPLVEVQVLRIVQEALANARKHAHARTVCVTFALADGHAQVEVQDDGCGFDPLSDDARGGVGLRVMRERAEEIGGTFAVQSAAGAGTQVILTVPVHVASG